MSKIYKLALLCLFLIHVQTIIKAQNLDLLDEGETLFNQKKYTEAYLKFVEMKVLLESSNFYNEINFTTDNWILQCHLNGVPYDQNHVKNTLYVLLQWKSTDALIFYSTHPDVQIKSLDKILERVFGKTDNAYEQFLLSNYYATLNKGADEKLAFEYFAKSITNGFSDTVKIMESAKVKELDEERFYDVLIQNNFVSSEHQYRIKKYVEKNINHWQQKGKFEKTNDYIIRVNEESREQKIKELAQAYIDSAGMTTFSFNTALNEYDADNETFKISFANGNNIFLNVPIRDAPEFDAKFNQLNVENIQFTLYRDRFELLHCEYNIPGTSKTYIYDSKDVAEFNSSLLSLNIEPFKMDANVLAQTRNESTYNNSYSATTISEIDINIPQVEQNNPNKYALIIGNEDYQSYQNGLNNEQNVEFAVRDASIFKEYCLKTLGIPAENIVFACNAGAVQMNREVQKIKSIIKNTNGKAEVIVYFAGHGFPDQKTGEPYLMPVDVSGSSLDFALSRKTLLEELTYFPAKQVVVILDACFSGGGRDLGLLSSRGVKIVPRSSAISGNLLVFSASSSDQAALPFREQRHGLFSYFFMKKLQETNGKVNLGELDAYLREQVPVKSVLTHSREQNPEVQVSPAVNSEWKTWGL